MEIHNSIKGRNPSFHNLVGELSDKIPSFKTRGEEVRVIYEPREFYDTLLVSFPLLAVVRKYRKEDGNAIDTDVG